MSNILKGPRISETVRRLKNEPIEIKPAKPVEVEPAEAILEADELSDSPEATSGLLDDQSVIQPEPVGPDPHELASEIIEAAEAKAQSILEEARLGYDAKFKEAEASGYVEGSEKGYTEGYAKAISELFSVTAAFKDAVTGIEALRERVLSDMASQVTDVVKTAVRNVLSREPACGPGDIFAIVTDALHRTRDRERVIVRLDPSDIGALKEKRGDLLSAVDGIKNLEIVEDRSVGPGGCVVETDSGKIDASIEAQVKKLDSVIDNHPPRIDVE